MNEQMLKELLTAEMNNSAPDKDALWARIEGRLQPKSAEAQPHRRTVININALKAVAAAAASILLIVAVPAVLQRSGSRDESSMTDAGATNAEDSESMVMDDAPADDAVGGTVSVKPKEFMNYNELEFDSYSLTYIECSGEPYGESYFVEEDILADTERIIHGEVTAVYLSEDGESLCYEMQVLESYPESTESVITVESRSAYAMKRGREYLVPLARTDEGWRTVFDSVPQTEFTANGGAVYYIGWSSLDRGGSQSLIYPQEHEDEYFYDRMMYSHSGDITALIKKWEALERS